MRLKAVPRPRRPAWDRPEDGGKPATYKIERRQLPSGTWTLIEATFDTEVTVSNLEPGVKYEHRIIATNRAGEGPPSNTVTVAG